MSSLIDISIKNFKDILADETKLQQYLHMNCKIQQKSDGIKIVLVFNKDKEWEVHYKSSIIKKETFNGFDDSDYKELNTSSGYAQYIHIFNHLETIDVSKLIPETKFFCEFIIRKATLTRSYTNTGHLVLLSVEDNWNDEETLEYAKILKLRTPKVLANDKFSNLLEHLDSYMNTESVFGGIEEGIVLTFENKEKFKLIQADQHDKATRREIKANFYESPVYYTEIIRSIKNQPNLDEIEWDKIRDNIKFPKSKKLSHLQQIEDYLERSLVYKNIKENGIALIQGKFRIFTKEHENLIKKALDDKDIKKVVICLISSKETKASRYLRFQMIKEVITNIKTSKEIEIIEHSSGNLFSIFKKLKSNPLKLFCGTDRVESYKQMLANLYTDVVETKRTENDLSASKVIENINDFNYFKESVSPKVVSMYNEIEEFYSNS